MTLTKYLLVALVAAGLMGGMVSANNESCSPHCDNPGPQGPGAQKGDRQPIHVFPRTQKESSNSESRENDTSTENHRIHVIY